MSTITRVSLLLLCQDNQVFIVYYVHDNKSLIILLCPRYQGCRTLQSTSTIVSMNKSRSFEMCGKCRKAKCQQKNNKLPLECTLYDMYRCVGVIEMGKLWKDLEDTKGTYLVI